MNDLTQRLAREAEGFDRRGGSPLHIEQVLERAGEIKRGRRLRATLVMAAAVLAIAVPTIVVASGGQRASEGPTPAHAVKKDLSPLRLTGLEQGGAPSLGYVVDGVLHQDDASTRLGAPGAVRAVVPLGSRFLVETDTGEGVLRASVVPAPPDFVGQPSSWPVEGGLAASRSGHLAAFVQPDGTPVVVEDDGRVSVDLPRIRQGTGFDVVGVTGTTCKAPSDHVCAVWVRTSGQTPESWVSTP